MKTKKQSVRVLHVVHTMDCGGIETMLMNVYRNIDRSKVQFDFLVNGSKDNYYTKEIESLGGNVVNVTPKRVSFRKNIKETVQAMKDGNYDIVHIHQDSMIAPAIWCAKKAGIRDIITHAHTTNIVGIRRRIMTYVGRHYINKNASTKYACSDAAAKWIYGKKTKDYIIIKNAIDSNRFVYDEEKYQRHRKQMGYKKTDFVIGTCGRLSPEKNQKFLIDILAEMKKDIPNAKLVIIGDGPEKQAILDYSVNKKVEKDVMITGMVNNTDYYYSILDCFVLPSLYEGLPLTGIEAQAAGLPSYFSTGITKELKITSDVAFLPLSDGAQEWCDTILNSRVPRKKTISTIKKSGYDLGENILVLQTRYISSRVYGMENSK